MDSVGTILFLLLAVVVSGKLARLTRAPLPLPTLTVAPKSDLFAYELSDFVVSDYAPWPHIKAAVAV